MELEFVAWLRDRLPPSPSLSVGIGDDAALVELSRPELVIASDLLVDGVHFITAEHSAERIGHKAFAVNLSDLAAMAASPVGATVSLALPARGADGASPRDLAVGLVEGMLPLAERFGCPIVGGDTNVGPGPLVISVTVFGEPTQRGVVCRDGARPGDVLFVTGPLGGSINGHHLDFTPRLAESIRLHREFHLHAMIDLSDGLALDLHRLCESSGVGAELEAAQIPITRAAVESGERSGRDPLEHALTDGEDFELLVAIDPAEAERASQWSPVGGLRLTRIGEITAERAVTIRYGEGMVSPLRAEGYEHR